MQRPSFREIPNGFGGPSVVRNMNGVLSSSVLGPSMRCSLDPGGDLSSLNAYGSFSAMLGDVWLGVGLQVPVDLSQREPYFVSMKAFVAASAAGMVALPFVGSASAVSSNALVTVHDFLCGVVSSVGNNFFVDFSGAVRPSAVYDGVWTDRLLVFGVAFANLGAVQTPRLYRASINVTRFNAPDYGVSAAVN